MYELEKIKMDLKSSMSEFRFEHSVRVAEESRNLANVYHYDEERAYLTGLVHDIAKEFTREQNEMLIKKYQLSESLLDEDYRRMLHSDIGALVVMEKYGLDEEIAHAIRSHTVGNIPMNLLDKILFVADKTEPGKNYDGIEVERKVAYENLDQAMILCLENYHKTLRKEKKKIYPRSLEVLEYFKKNN